MKIAKGLRVTLEYQLARADSQEIIESSAETGPLEYVHGDGRMLPALERRIEGLVVGDERKGVIAAAEAYGAGSSLPTTALSRRHFPPGATPQVGERFEAKDPQGRPVAFVVLGVDGERIQVRFLHPLAEQDLSYALKILKIVDPKVPPPPPPG
ncbi:MAG: FKBP-type peptidyl-prolyl cis-trans isomerase [Proteobacteria bacterium]|nr:FKBP-type peptidyl-prolyl cis-trans isomerase [Pseudomonadota bacterium]